MRDTSNVSARTTHKMGEQAMVKHDMLRSLLDAQEVTEMTKKSAVHGGAEDAIREAAQATRALIEKAARGSQKIAARVRA